ncbi:unnamed protein product [Choristocarpus tenellus]
MHYNTKAVFLAVVHRPRKLSNGVWFDGKIGIWSVVDTMVVQHPSKHCSKGTSMHVSAMVDGERYKKVLIEDVIPAIKARKPRLEGHSIFVQQDRAKPHTKGGSWRQLRRDPASQLPHLNINDLEFFHYIQLLKQDVGVTNTEELMEATMEAFDVYP